MITYFSGLQKSSQNKEVYQHQNVGFYQRRQNAGFYQRQNVRLLSNWSVNDSVPGTTQHPLGAAVMTSQVESNQEE